MTEKQMEMVQKKFSSDLGSEVSFSEIDCYFGLVVSTKGLSFRVSLGVIKNCFPEKVLCIVDDKKFVYKNIDIFEISDEGEYYTWYPSLLEILNEQHNTEIGQFCKDDEFPSKSDF